MTRFGLKRSRKWRREAGRLTEYERLQGNPAQWLLNNGIEPTPERLVWSNSIFSGQNHLTVQAMARAVVRETSSSEYLKSVRTVFDTGVSVYLVAGERSVSDWDVPVWVRSAARSVTIISGAGHMMMLEQPEIFCDAVSRILDGHNFDE